jgi:hypothetical protein
MALQKKRMATLREIAMLKPDDSDFPSERNQIATALAQPCERTVH